MVLACNDDTFKETVLEASVPTVVDFWAPWCGPCKMMGPVLESLSTDMEDIQFVKVNIDSNPDLAHTYKIRSIPALLLFIDGKVVSEMVGAGSKQKVRDWVEKHINKDL